MFLQPSDGSWYGDGGWDGSPAQGLPSASLSSLQVSRSFGVWPTSAILKTPQAVSPAPEKPPTGGRFGLDEPSALQRKRLPTVKVKLLFGEPSGFSGVMPVSLAIPLMTGNFDFTVTQTWEDDAPAPGALCVAEAVSQALPGPLGIFSTRVMTTVPPAGMSPRVHGKPALHGGDAETNVMPALVASFRTTLCAVEPVAGPSFDTVIV